MTTPFDIHTSNAQQAFQLLHILTNTFIWLMAVLTGLKWYLVLVCISIMTSDTEHLFTWWWQFVYPSGEISLHVLLPTF